MQLDLFLQKNGTIQTQFFYYEEWKWDNKIQFFCIEKKYWGKHNLFGGNATIKTQGFFSFR